LTVFAGPNGSGKSSILALLDFEGIENLLVADAIARRIDPEVPQRAAMAAGREMIRRAGEYVQRRESFAVETTLAGGWATSTIQRALRETFFIRLVYICVDNPERCVQRVRERVAQGGHDVPDRDIRRRYARSLSKAWQAIRIVDEALAFDNSGAEPRFVFEMRTGGVFTTAEELPAWAAGLLQETG